MDRKMLHLVLEFMDFAGKLPSLANKSGKDKKKWVMDAIYESVVVDPEDVFSDELKDVVSLLIDTLIEVQNGELTFTGPKKPTRFCC